METKFKIIETPDYVLVVSDEDASNSYIYFTGTPTGIYKTGIKYKDYNNYEFYEDVITGMSDTYFAKISKKIIAHQPKGNAPELDLPLLPEIVVNNNIEKLAEECFENLKLTNPKGGIKEFIRLAVHFGYNKCKEATKIFNEEDMIKAMEMICNSTISNYGDSIFDLRIGDNMKKYISEYTQSLKQLKTPKWFVAETEKDPTDRSWYNTVVCRRILKTTTINGKTYLMGTYLYE